MGSFNNGKPYHGSEQVVGGRLKGATDGTGYFYLFCPQCPDNEIVRILEYGAHAEEAENLYNKDCKSKAKCAFTLAFKIHCEKCGHTDFVKISNTGWQGGTHRDALARFGA